MPFISCQLSLRLFFSLRYDTLFAIDTPLRFYAAVRHCHWLFAAIVAALFDAAYRCAYYAYAAIRHTPDI